MIPIRIKSITKNKGRRKTLFFGLSGTLLFLVVFYLYAVNATAWNGARWEEVEKQSRALTASVSALEAEYLSRKQSITLAFAYEHGFVEAQSVVFVPALRTDVVTLR